MCNGCIDTNAVPQPQGLAASTSFEGKPFMPQDRMLRRTTTVEWWLKDERGVGSCVKGAAWSTVNGWTSRLEHLVCEIFHLDCGRLNEC